ncbi:MAG TPA: hypothetical protein PKU77_15010 [Ferruginibacter sp.]|nr:hypothetical protein [Ferruginibacter sp.]
MTINKTWLLGIITIISISCNRELKKMPSKNHLERLKLNLSMSALLSKNSNPKFKHLLCRLDSVYYNDQLYRDLNNPGYLNQNIAAQKRLDLQNQKIVANIIDSFGYLNSEDVGIIGQKAINTTLLHSQLTFKKKYQPLLEEAFKNKRLFVNTYAAFIDKISLQENNLQKYGTQFINYKGKYLYAPLNIDSLQFYRNQLGQPLDSTGLSKGFDNLNINPAEYKRLLPALIDYYKKNIAPLNE